MAGQPFLNACRRLLRLDTDRRQGIVAYDSPAAMENIDSCSYPYVVNESCAREASALTCKRLK
jgi:hypothetical protein